MFRRPQMVLTYALQLVMKFARICTEIRHKVSAKAPLAEFRAQECTISTNGLVLEILENFLLQLPDNGFGFSTPSLVLLQIHIPRVCDFDFMAIMNLRIFMRFDTSYPHSLFTVKSLINFQICYHQTIKITNIKIMKICRKTKIRVLNVNLESEISYDAS